MTALFEALASRRLVVFDVDGTLYRQAPVRAKMALELLQDAAKRGDRRVLRALGAYRRERERLADAETGGFEVRALEAAARAADLDVERAESLVEEWMHRRPLRHLGAAVYPGVPALFERLREHGVVIAVLSDHPVGEKLAAMQLCAQIVVSATDPEVDVQKPHPKGLERVVDLAGATPSEAVLVGDRMERDGAAAARAGTAFLLRGAAKDGMVASFRRYGGALVNADAG